MDDMTPATKGDLKALATHADLLLVKTELKSNIQRLEQKLESKFDRVHEDIDRVLAYLVDDRKRIMRLEKAIAA